MPLSDSERFSGNEVLTDIKLNNPEILEVFNGWSDYIHSVMPKIEKWFKCVTEEPYAGAGVTDIHRKEVVAKGEQHIGFPEMAVFIDLRPGNSGYKGNDQEAFDFIYEVEAKYYEFNERMVIELGSRRNALCVIYPKNGYVGWHNNANASSYNLICTHSSTGEGYWKHRNPKTNEIEQIDDLVGWQAKASYFGAYVERDPETLIYHAAQCTGGYRMTVSWMFDRDNEDWWLDAIDELEAS